MGGGDDVAASAQAYLRHVQYRDSSRLAARARLHVKYSTAPVAWFPWVVSQIDWPADAEVLEVGCGAGWMWAEASARLPGDLSLTLSDISAGMAREALGRVGSLGRYRRATAAVADVQRLPFADRSFDVVVATYVLHHVPDPRRAVAEMARVLRPSGAVLIACVGGDHLAELREIREEVFGPEVPAELAWSFDADAGAAMLPAHFGSVEWRPYADQLDCRDPDDVVEYLASTPPVEGAAPDERARVVDAVRARFGRGGGRLRVRKDTGLFVCRAPRHL